MTISSTNRKAGPFIGNDSASVFPFAFSVFSAADVYAVQLNTVTSVETPLTLGADYTVTLNADQSANPGGTLTLTAGPLATGLTLTLTTAVTPLQLTDLTNQGGFYPRVITRAFDKLTVLAQQILERLGRSLTLPLSAPANVSTALPVPEANKALVWNSTATGLANYDASQFATSIIGTNRVVDRFLANGTAGPYALSTDPLNINNTLVFVNGEYRTHNTYTVSGASITFDSTVAGGAVVEVVQQLAVTYPVTALSDNVVSTGKVVDGAITLAKLATAVQTLVNGALQRSGGTMTGALTLSGNATNPLEAVPLQQVAAALSFAGLALSATGANANVSISASELLLRGADGSPRLVSGVSLSLNTSGAGANGLDTGSIAASTWYTVWVINNGTTTAALLSLSAAAPTMPAGYTHKARVGWIRADATANKYPLAFRQIGRSVEYQPASGTNLMVYPQAASSTTTISVTPVSLASYVPPSAARVGVRLRQDSVASTTNGIAVRPTETAEDVAAVLGINGGRGVGTFWLTLASMTVYYSITTSTGTGVLSVLGWEDNL